MDFTVWLFDETSLPQGFVHAHTNNEDVHVFTHSFHGVFPA